MVGRLPGVPSFPPRARVLEWFVGFVAFFAVAMVARGLLEVVGVSDGVATIVAVAVGGVVAGPGTATSRAIERLVRRTPGPKNRT